MREMMARSGVPTNRRVPPVVGVGLRLRLALTLTLTLNLTLTLTLPTDH
jgi:hypothetical protein